MGAAYTVNTLYLHSWYLLYIKFDKYSIIVCSKVNVKFCEKVVMKVVERQFSNCIVQRIDKYFLPY